MVGIRGSKTWLLSHGFPQSSSTRRDASDHVRANCKFGHCCSLILSLSWNNIIDFSSQTSLSQRFLKHATHRKFENKGLNPTASHDLIHHTSFQFSYYHPLLVGSPILPSYYSQEHLMCVPGSLNLCLLLSRMLNFFRLRRRANRPQATRKQKPAKFWKWFHVSYLFILIYQLIY